MEHIPFLNRSLKSYSAQNKGTASRQVMKVHMNEILKVKNIKSVTLRKKMTIAINPVSVNQG